MKTCILPLAFLSAISAASGITALDSSQFDYKYEMAALPMAQNLDNDGAYDFTANEGTKVSLGTGVNIASITIDASAANTFLMSGAAAGSAGGAWQNSGISAATGYTVEARLRITSTAGAQAGAFVVNASVDDTVNAWLKFWSGSIWWGETQICNVTATDYHTYRIVREAGSSVHSVYVDGELVASNLGNGFTYSSPLKRLLVGSPGSTYRGKVQVAFIRFQKGGYAPPTPGAKSAKRWSGEFPIQYEMTANDTRFVGPTGGGTDWTGSVDGSATVTQNGKLSVAPPQGKLAYWRANDSVWSERIGSDKPYTVEFAIQIRGKWNLSSVGDRVVQIWCGNQRAAGVFYIGTSSVIWEPNGAATYTTLDTRDNTNAMHTFRVTYDGATRHGYTLWRDNEVIGSCLVDSTVYNSALGGNVNFLRFGVTSTSSVGGSFDVDYIRWTTDGAWDWKGPPEAFVMTIR